MDADANLPKGYRDHIALFSKPCELYRIFDAGGRLLYVGISRNAKRRIYQHKCTAEWACHIRRHTVEKFPIRQQAVDAEAAAIKSEKPLYNIKHGSRKAKSPVQRIPEPQASPRVDYLREMVEVAHMAQFYDESIPGAEEAAHERFRLAMEEHQAETLTH